MFVCVRYKKSTRYLKMGYEQEFIDYLQELVGLIDKRIKRGHARLAQNQTFASVSTLHSHSMGFLLTLP